MPRRFSVNTRFWIYHFLSVRDGEWCARCFAEPTQPISATQNESFPATLNSAASTVSATQNSASRRHKITLEIDHIDGNHRNNAKENLRLLCKRCNVGESNRRRSSSDFSLSQKRRLRKEGNSATRVVRSAVDYAAGTSQMQANNICEPNFRNWLLATLETAEHLDKEDVINSGAEITGCSLATATSYLKKLTSSAGPLVERKEILGGLVVMLKPELAKTNGDD